VSVVAEQSVGSVVSIWRYPVKSMLGEELNASQVGARGLIGDRAYAVVDPETGKVASAKHPRKWPRLLECASAFVEAPRSPHTLPPVQVTLPGGRVARTDESDFDSAIADMLGRPGSLQTAIPEQAVLEEYWPDIEGLDLRDAVTDEALPEGTFFDLATVHLLTTGTLDTLRTLYPGGRFDVRRFRPNFVVRSMPDADPFPENGWVDRTIAIGEEVRLHVSRQCPRCVMTTLAQADLPNDPGILRAAAKHNSAHVGVYAEVVQGGTVCRDDPVRMI